MASLRWSLCCAAVLCCALPGCRCAELLRTQPPSPSSDYSSELPPKSSSRREGGLLFLPLCHCLPAPPLPHPSPRGTRDSDLPKANYCASDYQGTEHLDHMAGCQVVGCLVLPAPRPAGAETFELAALSRLARLVCLPSTQDKKDKTKCQDRTHCNTNKGCVLWSGVVWLGRNYTASFAAATVARCIVAPCDPYREHGTERPRQGGLCTKCAGTWILVLADQQSPPTNHCHHHCHQLNLVAL